MAQGVSEVVLAEVITTASMSFGLPLPEPESEFPSYPHYPQQGVSEVVLEEVL